MTDITFPTHMPPVAGVDIGGTKVAVSVADGRGVRGKLSQPTAVRGGRDALAAQVVDMVRQSCALAGVAVADLAGVGVSSCGPFVMRDGMVELNTPNICGGMAGAARGLPNDWPTAYLEAPLRQVFPVVRVENDGIAALEAERRWGALRDVSNCAYVTWSTGIGAGVCVDGRALRGKNGNAGHAGHMFVSDNGDALCGCGNLGDVEALIAGNAIPRRFAAQAVVDELCRVMGRALYNLTILFDLQRISLGGSVFWHHREFLLPKLQAYVHGKLPALTEGVDFVPAGLGDRVGDYAALALVVGD